MDRVVVPLTPEDECYPRGRLSGWPAPLPPLYAIGNPELIRLSLTALFCSRRCPGDAIIKAYDLARELRDGETPATGGFHTPVEKDMLEILLKGKGPIVICPARGLQGMRLAKPFSAAIQEGRLLLLTIFPENTSRITIKAAHERNLFVAALAEKVIFVHVEPGGETDRVAKMFPEKSLKR